MKSSHRAIRVAPRFTEDQQAVFTKKHRLPLTTALSTYVQLFDTDSGYALCLYEKRDDVECRFRADLNKAHVVNNTTEKGPCLFLMCENGHFEFQTDGNSMFKFWLGVFTVCGVSLIRFTDLYKQQQCIGEGTFAKVYSGRHRYTHQEVCIKEIAKAGNQSSSVYTEIGILRKVVHPYINRLHAAYEIEDKIYLVLEYLRGGELFSFLNENGPYIEAHAKVAIRRILVALECLHSQGIVHRDLKNENLILETKDDPTKLKIIDFGLASTLDSPAMKQRCGSPGYAAPEILDHQRYGVKVDLFSAGVILYTVLSGSPPFGGSTISQVIKSNSRAKISFQHHRWKSVSQSAKDLITWMTARNPDLRCSALQALTHPWFEGVPSSISTTAPKTSIRTLEAVAASKKTAVPEVGSASTCASAQGANTPFGTDSTSSSATQRSPHVRPVAGVPGVRNQPIVTTTTVRVVDGGDRAGDCTENSSAGDCTENSSDESNDAYDVSLLKPVATEMLPPLKTKNSFVDRHPSEYDDASITSGFDSDSSESDSSEVCPIRSPISYAAIVPKLGMPQDVWGGKVGLRTYGDAHRGHKHPVNNTAAPAVSSETKPLLRGMLTRAMGLESIPVSPIPHGDALDGRFARRLCQRNANTATSSAVQSNSRTDTRTLGSAAVPSEPHTGRGVFRLSTQPHHSHQRALHKFQVPSLPLAQLNRETVRNTVQSARVRMDCCADHPVFFQNSQNTKHAVGMRAVPPSVLTPNSQTAEIAKLVAAPLNTPIALTSTGIAPQVPVVKSSVPFVNSKLLSQASVTRKLPTNVEANVGHVNIHPNNSAACYVITPRQEHQSLYLRDDMRPQLHQASLYSQRRFQGCVGATPISLYDGTACGRIRAATGATQSTREGANNRTAVYNACYVSKNVIPHPLPVLVSTPPYIARSDVQSAAIAPRGGVLGQMNLYNQHIGYGRALHPNSLVTNSADRAVYHSAEVRGESVHLGAVTSQILNQNVQGLMHVGTQPGLHRFQDCSAFKSIPLRN